MNALLRMPQEKVCGNLIWMAPYVYPSELLADAMNDLRAEGYWISLFPEGDGITFDAKGKGHDQVERDLRYAFSWMQIHVGGSAELLTIEQLVILPVQRLLLHKPVISQDICLFPPEEMQVKKMKLLNMRGQPFGAKTDTSNLRDHITQMTNVDRSVFERQPLVVFRDPITYEAYLWLTHMDDNELIRKYSRRADDVLDMLRFYEGDFFLPEMLWIYQCPNGNIIGDGGEEHWENFNLVDPFDVQVPTIIGPSYFYFPNHKDYIGQERRWRQMGKFLVQNNEDCLLPFEQQADFTDLLVKIVISADQRKRIREHFAAGGLDQEWLDGEKDEQIEDILKNLKRYKPIG